MSLPAGKRDTRIGAREALVGATPSLPADQSCVEHWLTFFIQKDEMLFE